MGFSESGPIHPFSLHVSHSSPFLEQSPFRNSKVLHETLRSDNGFSEAAKAYIYDSLPPSLALSDSESLRL